MRQLPDRPLGYLKGHYFPWSLISWHTISLLDRKLGQQPYVRNTIIKTATWNVTPYKCQRAVSLGQNDEETLLEQISIQNRRVAPMGLKFNTSVIYMEHNGVDNFARISTGETTVGESSLCVFTLVLHVTQYPGTSCYFLLRYTLTMPVYTHIYTACTTYITPPRALIRE